jgi:hypothetical protein
MFIFLGSDCFELFYFDRINKNKKQPLSKDKFNVERRII